MSDEEPRVGPIFIPAPVVARDDLTLTKKALYGKILGLQGENGYCHAGNEYLARHLGVSAGTVSNYVSELVSMGLLRREVLRDEEQRVTERRLFPLLTPSPSTVREGPHLQSGTSPSRDGRDDGVDDGSTHTGAEEPPSASDLRKEDGRYAYPDRFERVWRIYPPRGDAPSEKLAAYRKWRSQVRNGTDPAELEEAARNYRRFCKDDGRIDSRHVKQAKTFFGPDEPWREFVGDEVPGAGASGGAIGNGMFTTPDELAETV